MGRIGWACVALAAALAGGTAYARVDANAASVEQLLTVPGVGPSIAERIVAERRRGPYRDLADLEARVRGVGVATARRMAAGGLVVRAAAARAPEAPAAGEGTDGRPSRPEAGRAARGDAGRAARPDVDRPPRTGAPAGPWRPPGAASR